LEIRDGPIDFSKIHPNWFFEPSFEFREFRKIPRIFIGIYLAREDLRKAFDIKKEKGLTLFYDWIVNEVRFKNLPNSYLELIPKNKLLNKQRKISKQNIFNLMLMLNKRFPNLASNKYLKNIKMFIRKILTSTDGLDSEIEKIDFGLFERNHLQDIDKSGINLFGYFDASTGVANGTKLMNTMLDHIDIDKSLYTVKIDDNSIITPHDKERKYHGISLFHINADQTPNCIPYIPPKLKNSYKIGFWAWELERFPAKDLKSGSLLNDLWVPSKFIANAIERSCNFSPKVIPHPVEAHLHGDFGMSDKFNLKDDIFKINTTFDLDSYVARKNPFGSIEAYSIASKKNKDFKENTIMVIKISGSSGKKDIIQTIINFREKHNLNIKIIDHFLTNEEMHGLRNISDTFISLHRSEGFGLNIIENMNAGNTVIATNYSGNTDFMNDDNSLPVDFKLVPLKENEYPSWKGQFWAEPSLDDASEKLLWAYQNQGKASKIIKKAQNDIKTKYSINAVSKLVNDELVKI